MNPIVFRIESLKDNELEACLDTIHKAVDINCRRFGFTKENYPSCAAYMSYDELKKAKESGTHIYAAWADGKIAGCVQIKRDENKIYHFRRFAVLPEYQNKGIGRALIAFAKNKATIYGGKKLKLLMVYENEELRTLYSSCGFKLTETKRDNEHPFLCGIYEMDL